MTTSTPKRQPSSWPPSTNSSRLGARRLRTRKWKERNNPVQSVITAGLGRSVWGSGDPLGGRMLRKLVTGTGAAVMAAGLAAAPAVASRLPPGPDEGGSERGGGPGGSGPPPGGGGPPGGGPPSGGSPPDFTPQIAPPPESPPPLAVPVAAPVAEAAPVPLPAPPVRPALEIRP